MHFRFGQGPLQTVQSTVFAPPQEEHRSASEQHNRSKAYLTDAQPEDPSDRGTGHVNQMGLTGAGPKHGELSCSQGTLLHVVLHVAQSHSAINPLPFHSLHIPGPSQCPRVDKPHPASVAGTRPAVVGCARKDVAQVVRNGSCVSNRHNCKFSQNALNGNDVENRFPVIKLV